MKIQILDNDLINKIAAGEVIERPASVIKEFIENSIDAKANKIEIQLTDSGKKKIIFSDDGEGMELDDLKICTLKHSTSKIKTVDDLFRINSLGFRGEALSSIETISKLSIQSRYKYSDIGYELSNQDKTEIKKVAMNIGTKIIVEDLFYNTPARLNYLKNDYVELNHISDIVKKYALSFPNKSFKLINNKKIIFSTSGQNDELTNIQLIFNDTFTKHLLSVEEKDIKFNFSLKGFISEPGYLVKNSDNIIFFLNNRFIKSKFLYDALIDAYKTMIFLSEKPVAIIYLNIDSSDYDINIHPKKLDVKFKDEIKIYNFLVSTIRKTIEDYNKNRKDDLLKKSLIQKELINDSISNSETIEINREIPSSKIYSLRNRISDNLVQEDVSEYFENKQETQENPIVESSFSKKPSKKYSVMGMIDNTYIFIKIENSVLIVDQHALHERILFDDLMKNYKTKINSDIIESQILMSPIKINLSKNKYEETFNNEKKLKNLGLIFEPFGDSAIILRKIPSVFMDISDKTKFISNLVEELSISKIEDLVFEKLAMMSCKAAIKAHDELTEIQLNNLLDILFNSDIKHTCPHGRPIFVELGIKEIEKIFKR